MFQPTSQYDVRCNVCLPSVLSDVVVHRRHHLSLFQYVRVVSANMQQPIMCKNLSLLTYVLLFCVVWTVHLSFDSCERLIVCVGDIRVSVTLFVSA